MLTPVAHFSLPYALADAPRFMEAYDGYCFNSVLVDKALSNFVGVPQIDADKWPMPTQQINLPHAYDTPTMSYQQQLNGRLSPKLTNLLTLDRGPNAGKQFFYSSSKRPSLYLGDGRSTQLSGTSLEKDSYAIDAVFADYGDDSYLYYQSRDPKNFNNLRRYRVDKYNLTTPVSIACFGKSGANLRDFEGRLYYDANNVENTKPFFLELDDVAAVAATNYPQPAYSGINEPQVLYRGDTGIKMAYLHMVSNKYNSCPVVLKDDAGMQIDEFEYTPVPQSSTGYIQMRSFMMRYLDAGAGKRFVIVLQWERPGSYASLEPMPYILRAYKVVGDTLVRVAAELIPTLTSTPTLSWDGSFGYFVGQNEVFGYVFDPVAEQFVLSKPYRLRTNSYNYAATGLTAGTTLAGNIDSQGRLWLATADRYAYVFDLDRPIAPKITISGQTLNLFVSNTKQFISASVAIRIEGGKFQDGSSYKVVQVPTTGVTLPFTGIITSYDAIVLE